MGTPCDQRSHLPQNIEVRPSRNDLHLLEFHDIFQLDAHFPSLTQELGVQEMPYGPIISESVLLVSKLRGGVTEYKPVALPLVEDVQQGQMVAFGYIELFPRGIGFFHPFLGSIEHAGH